MKNLVLLFISFFIFSCDSEDNPVSVSNEIDVDWVLVKETLYSNPLIVRYYFFYSENTISHNLVQYWGNVNDEDVSLDVQNEEDFHILKINHGGQEFNYNIIDSFMGSTNEDGSFNGDGPCVPPSCGSYNVQCNYGESVSRIVYNQDSNYFIIFSSNGGNDILNSSSPNELIDYR